METTDIVRAAPVAIDLFAGAGGLGEGLEAAGINISAAVELHPQPALTYKPRHHFLGLRRFW
jgi:DNA (cytosine-5)-methyltransferase 1